MPIIVAFVVTWFSNKFNKKKNKLEIDKLREETRALKKSFLPLVIGTLQSIQDKIITSKIEALKLLVQIQNNFTFVEHQYIDGEIIELEYKEYIELLFLNFLSKKYDEYCTFHDSYSYLFPDKVFDILVDLKHKLDFLNESKKVFDLNETTVSEPEKKDIAITKDIVNLFHEAILAIRKDCYLDTSFIHDFVEENK